MWLPTADGTTGAGGSVLAGDARTEFCSASVDPFVGLRTSRGSAMSHRPFILILIAILSVSFVDAACSLEARRRWDRP